MAKRLIREMMVFNKNPWTDESTTVISVQSDGAGSFFEINQPGMEDFVANKATIRLNFDEIDEIYDALKTIRAQWDMAGVE